MLAGKVGTPQEIAVTTSVGLAAIDGDLAERFDDPGTFTQIAERAVLAARKAGRNSMRVYAPTARAA
jgi:GGDEF domain-containing protein